MAGFLHNKNHSFGDKACQDAFLVRLHLGDRLAKKVKPDKKLAKMMCLAVPAGSFPPSHSHMKLKQNHSENLMHPLRPLFPPELAPGAPTLRIPTPESPGKILMSKDSTRSTQFQPQPLNL